jgi:S1-C subfamily serine protease
MIKKYRYKLQLVLLCGYVIFSHNDAYAEEDINQIKNSVIKVYSTVVIPDNGSPWQSLSPMQITGSAAVISDNRILTNAHVVADAKYIQVQKNNDPNKYVAEVSFVSHYADLALLRVKDSRFFKDLKPLPIADLPEPYQEVTVLGYPIGGETLSITKGILSRIEQKIYAHSQSSLLAGQIDAAINPGNSGGPVIVDSKIVGIVMQAIASSATMNLGYFIPPSIIQHVLADSEDGKNDGFPELGFRTEKLENPAAKAVYGLNKDQNGILVVKVFEGSAAANKLQKNDVILKIDDYDISGNSTIKYSDTLKVDYKNAIDLHYVGDSVAITFVRAGKVQKTALIAQKSLKRYELVATPQFDTVSRYYIYGGIVFVPLDTTLLRYSDRSSLNLGSQLWESPDKKELVAALQVLPADVNFGYHDTDLWVVDFVNDVPVKDFLQFAQLLKKNTAKNVVFENENGYQIVINHQEAIKSEADIFNLYKIPARSSQGLFDKAGLD